MFLSHLLNIKLLTFIKQKFTGGRYLRIHSKDSKRILTSKTNTKREIIGTMITYDSDKSSKTNYLNADRTDLKTSLENRIDKTYRKKNYKCLEPSYFAN